MRIGIDCRTILNPHGGEQAGVGHYTYYLIKNLLDIDKKNEYILFFDSRFTKVEEFKKDNVTIRFFPFYQYKKYLPITYSQMLISAVLTREKLDVFHSPANVVPLPYNKTSVVTIHDLGIYKFPEFFPKKFLSNQAFSTRVLVPKTLDKVSKVIAVSKNTKRDIVEEFGIDEEKIEVVYEGVLENKEICANITGFESIKKKYGINDKFILFLGTIEPRKNITSLIRAFRNAFMVYESPLSDYQLIIAGGRGWSDQPIYKSISDANASILGIKEKRGGQERRSGLDIRSKIKKDKKGERRKHKERRKSQPVKYIGYVSHDDKVSLLCNSTCFAFPSLYEGFGLPVLEAMSLGVPVITSNLSSLPEVTGSNGAILINPNKESEIVDALGQIVTDEGLRESLSISGHKRSKQFSWKKCAKDTLDVYESVVE
jgi:glycosyltransferase involved in cell wall biosynthesis